MEANNAIYLWNTNSQLNSIETDYNEYVLVENEYSICI